MTTRDVPMLTLNSGARIPQLGLGTYKMPKNDTQRLVEAAFEIGYRHIDTATLYGNEAEVGAAFRASGLAREEVFVTTKLWNTDRPHPRAAFDRSLDELGLDAVDLYLIHWPQPERGDAPAAWRDFVSFVEEGRARSIGVSNFEIDHIEELVEATGTVPAVNQIELHPYHQQRALTSWCADQGIAVEAWAPIARGAGDLLAEAAVESAAAAHRKTPAQIVLRWHLQQGRIVFPKSVHVERLRENFELFDFELAPDEMQAIDELQAAGVSGRTGMDPRTFNDR